jgi:hypothetical protein
LKKLLVLFVALICAASKPTSVFDDVSPLHSTSETVELAQKIYRWKMGADQGAWFECGDRYTEEEMKWAALDWADAILKAQKETSYVIRRKSYHVDLREALGIFYAESRFDSCALGPNPRKFAYAEGLLQKPKKGFSHSIDEILWVLNNPKWQPWRLADLGGGQIVWSKSNKRATFQGDPVTLLELKSGTKEVFKLLAQRGQQFKSVTPSAYWPGTMRHLEYYIRIFKCGHNILYSGGRPFQLKM